MEMSRLKIEPGDVLVVNMPHETPYRQIVTVRESMQKMFPQNPCVVLTNNTSLSAVPKAQLKAMLGM